MPSFLSSIFGSKPNVPTLPVDSLPQQQTAAIGANVAALPSAESLAGSVNTFNQAQVLAMLKSFDPSIAGKETQISSNLSSLLSGDIPQDVQDQIQRSGAARSLGGGYAGSGMQRNLVARDLGLTSLDLQSKGLSSAESWMATMGRMTEPGQFNVSSMFITPEQQYRAVNEQNMQQWQRQMMANEIAAAPDPVASGLFEMLEPMTNAQKMISAVRGGPPPKTPTDQYQSGVGRIGPRSDAWWNDRGTPEGPDQGTGEGMDSGDDMSTMGDVSPDMMGMAGNLV